MKKIFVTGINGLLGTNLTKDLLESGFIVKGLLRDITRYKGITHKNLELIQGNLFGDLTKTLDDIDCVIHIAAETRQNLTNYQHYKNINYNATVQLFHTAIRCKVKKFIFVSTVNTLGYGSLNAPGNEQSTIKPPFTNSFYAKSKLEAENHLLNLKDKIDVTIINPTFMLGAYDTKPSSGKIIMMGWPKKVIFYPPGGKNFVHVKDVSRGIINSLEKSINGERYIMANENLTYKEFFKRLNIITKQKPLMIKVPKPLLLIVGYLGDVLRLFKIKTSLSSTNMKILCINNYYSNKKSINHLNVAYQPIDNAITDAVNYFKETKIK
jgi:nucleoside-diphosphate-sugar epimerase